LIEEVTADGQLMTMAGQGGAAKPLEIRPGKQRFEFRYTALSLVAPEKVRFKCRLDGLETDWVEAGTRRVAYYSYLKPGDYTFRVVACNNDSVWSETGATLALRVLPYFWQTWWFSVCAMVTGAGVVGGGARYATRRRLRRRMEILERQRAVEKERARIAKDIHDDLGASLTRITLLSQSDRAELEDPRQAAADLAKIYTTARELTRAMDEIVWAVSPQHDTLDSLVTYLGKFAQDFLSVAGIRCRLNVPMQLPPLSLTAEVRHNLFLVLKEALNNVVKHAAATEVRVSLAPAASGFSLVVEDNGKGFDPARAGVAGNVGGGAARLSAGNGLSNMRKRLEEIGGVFEIDTARGEGTKLKFVVQLQN
jgi:signal transduction histidine kinase